MGIRQIVVVGGSHGIGAGIVRRCVSHGAEVTTFSRTPGETSGLAGVRHHSVDLVSKSIEKSDLPEVIDGFVYCPGTINLGPLRAVKADQLRSDFEINVVGAVQTLQAALSGLKRSTDASVVMFSTIAVATGLPMHTSVAAAKGAIEALVRTWAAELSPKIRVNAIAPALTDTPLAGKFLDRDEKREAMAAKYPLARIGTVDDMAAAADFLLSHESSWMTGQILAIDGGMSAVRK
ncbi:SDR family oxidoreductase [Rubripirellula sp.]|nr:SDR family oxidoreductase [Rubripirellula sp.]MDA7874652.1 SDR family oxidoreductase [Rhodopirellula sp.]MDA7906944.1 SDR family oxidoreductase [bacterium]MDB4477096.1 SDR family oxidoreductase [Rhodopirellula sp.]MDB4532774.1 SDR family oxidoreductase [bacterium]MDB4644806.1 SDR family oxidoreductase [Rubripirellula sp.]